jgi:hypothetical protein
MRILFAAILASAAVLGSAPAQAKGCIKGALVGGVAGHVAGRHGVLGAVAGCAVGRYRAGRQTRQRNSAGPSYAR